MDADWWPRGETCLSCGIPFCHPHRPNVGRRQVWVGPNSTAYHTSPLCGAAPEGVKSRARGFVLMELDLDWRGRRGRGPLSFPPVSRRAGSGWARPTLLSRPARLSALSSTRLRRQRGRYNREQASSLRAGVYAEIPELGVADVGSSSVMKTCSPIPWDAFSTTSTLSTHEAPIPPTGCPLSPHAEPLPGHWRGITSGRGTGKTHSDAGLSDLDQKPGSRAGFVRDVQLWQSAAVQGRYGYQRRRLWGIGEEAIDAFDELVDLTTSPSSEPGRTEQHQRSLLGFILDDLIGPRDAAARASVQTAPMRSGISAPSDARTWIVDLLALAARPGPGALVGRMGGQRRSGPPRQAPLQAPQPDGSGPIDPRPVEYSYNSVSCASPGGAALSKAKCKSGKPASGFPPMPNSRSYRSFSPSTDKLPAFG